MLCIQHYIASLTILRISLIHLPQIDADDVITRDEQIYVLIGAHAKCERTIKAQIALVKGCFAAFFSFKSRNRAELISDWLTSSMGDMLAKTTAKNYM